MALAATAGKAALAKRALITGAVTAAGKFKKQ